MHLTDGTDSLFSTKRNISLMRRRYELGRLLHLRGFQHGSIDQVGDHCLARKLEVGK
jgi:hypothetical protein